MKQLSLITVGSLLCLVARGQPFQQSNHIRETQLQHLKQVGNTKTKNTMKVEIWSDVMCPFCYIGKRKFETALEQFAAKNDVQIEWKSFQLMPQLKTQAGRKLDQLLSEEKGIPLEKAKAMNSQVVTMAKNIGLTYDLDKAVPANTFNAHRFSHFAKTNGKQNEAEEKLFRAYFSEGKNIDDIPTLIELGNEMELDITALKAALENGDYAEDVRADIHEAGQIGIRGVPFFVFNRKYAVSGAQESKTFLETLEKSFAEWQKENSQVKLEVIEGKACTPEGTCD